jgi:uracil-DNA glycosylase
MTETSYKYKHPNIAFNIYCNNCLLGKNNKKGTAIGGAGPIDLTKVKLIVISDYPTFSDKFKGTPFTDNQKTFNRTDEKAQWLNGAALLRTAIQNLYNLDSYTECWMTYVIKCEPGKNTVKPEHLNICKNHLQDELHWLNEQAPNAPILITGTKAFATMKNLLPNVIGRDSNLQSSRRTILKYLGHPICVTVNPNIISKCQFRIEEDVYEYNEDVFVSKYTNYPILVGSPYWLFIKDLEILQPYFL